MGVYTYLAVGEHSPSRVRMDRSRHTKKFMGANQDRSSLSVAPEVICPSGDADVPVVVALRAPLRMWMDINQAWLFS